ncbi:WSD1 family O-acyltransferase [Georgenia sp. EYE_87]|uniref:WS/DGAT domain-containing protein n=1 Tax=Georgenia sp. EYE_87 TaxID=2853448 RepID=UPI002003378C|nr:WS/DGAT domain-containing protein [Georgenia sp. EYE_87]MCK6208980.1 WSD1 family O-acyltransferase [Georgenia sp. EYE_87]
MGSGRGLALVRADLGAVRAAAHAHGATVNDVVLSALAGGLRRLLVHRGVPVDGLVAAVYVPVTLRRGRGGAEVPPPGGGTVAPRRGGTSDAPPGPASGNLITQMVVPLPVGEADPARRLRQITTVTTERKARARPPLGALFGSRLLLPVLLRLIDRQSVNVTTADLRGPPGPVHLAGARVLEVFPVLPLIGKVALGVGALSYDGRLGITVVADGDAYPDLPVLVAGLEEELLRTARGSRSPAR